MNYLAKWMVMFKKTLIVIVILVIGLALFIYLKPQEVPLFYDEFKSNFNWDRQCTKVDPSGNMIMPFIDKIFKNKGVESTDGMLYLYTGEGKHEGGGEWSRTVNLNVGSKSTIEWKWAIHDAGEYLFWVRIRFNNHRSIFYRASDSKQPGFYRGKHYIPYKGEKYRDKEGRLRFFPAVTMLVERPKSQWTLQKRSIAEDFKQSFGVLPVDLVITQITIGMMDDDLDNSNEMGFEFLMIKDKT